MQFNDQQMEDIERFRNVLIAALIGVKKYGIKQAVEKMTPMFERIMKDEGTDEDMYIYCGIATVLVMCTMDKMITNGDVMSVVFNSLDDIEDDLAKKACDESLRSLGLTDEDISKL